MLIVKIVSKNDKVIAKCDMSMFADGIVRQCSKNPYLMGFVNNTRIEFSESFINLRFSGLFAVDNKSHTILVRMISKGLGELSLSDLLVVQTASSLREAGDVLINEKLFHFELTQNAFMLDVFARDGLFDEATIPSDFVCELTSQIMDKPVYNVAHPETKFDKSHYLFSLYGNPNLNDPYTRTPVDLNKSIIADRELKSLIDDYMRKVIVECTQKRMTRFNDTIYKYVGSNKTVDAFDKAFRMAAAENCVVDMKIIAERITAVNAQDNNPAKRYTALHWAVKRGAHDAVKFLLAMEGVDIHIKDASGKTAVDLAVASSNEAINAMFVEKLQQESIPAFRM